MLIRKNFLLPGLFFLCVLLSCRQKANKGPELNTTKRIPVSVQDSVLLSIDKSPMDMIYFPEDFPQRKMINPALGDPVARLIYSRPQKNGRAIFADSSVTQNKIQHYGEVWRLGANEATEIEFFKPVTVGNKPIAAGRYIMYSIPYPDKWKLIFNSNLYSWGLHTDNSKDVAEVELPVIKNNIDIEYFTMLFQNASNGCDLVMAWGNVKVVLPIHFQ